MLRFARCSWLICRRVQRRIGAVSLARSFGLIALPQAGSKSCEAMRLYDLLCAISVLTENAPNHVRHVATPTWSVFLQILEDAGPSCLVFALHGSAAANITTKSEMKAILTVHDPGLNVPPWGLNALRQTREFKCWKCGLAGHLARDCTSGGAASDQPPQAAINSLVQDEALLSLFQRQERVQEKLIEAQARLAQQDAKAAAAVVPSDAPHLAQMTAPSTPRAPLIIGGAQPEGYLYLGLNHGLSVWGHADVIAASVELDGDEGPPAQHT